MFLAILGALFCRANSVTLAAGTGNEALFRDAAQLFTPAEIATLQQMIGQPSSDGAINQLLEKKAAIEVTINPEARISIKRTPAPLTMPPCGKSGVWLIRIVNQGFVTAGLNVRTIESSVSLEPAAPPLSGGAVEYRLLRYTMSEIHQSDITLTVDAGSATSDIGGRAILPLLLQCR